MSIQHFDTVKVLKVIWSASTMSVLFNTLTQSKYSKNNTPKKSLEKTGQLFMLTQKPVISIKQQILYLEFL